MVRQSEMIFFFDLLYYTVRSILFGFKVKGTFIEKWNEYLFMSEMNFSEKWNEFLKVKCIFVKSEINFYTKVKCIFLWKVKWIF